MDRKKAVSYEPYEPIPAISGELWSPQKPVTEFCFSYNRLGPGTGQVSRTYEQTGRSSLRVQVAV